MKTNNLIKSIGLGLIMIPTIGNIAFAQPVKTSSQNIANTTIESQDSIKLQLQALEEKYGAKITPTKEILQKDIPLIEKGIQDSLANVEQLKSELSTPEKIEINSSSRVSQNFSGTAKVGASIPAIGVYTVYIPYKYTLVQAGGNPPYFANASTGGSYGAGIALGSYSHQDSWAKITSQNGRYNNVLELRAKGTIVYSAYGATITLPNQTFLKRLYL